MGICYSTKKVSGSNTNPRPITTTAVNIHHHNRQQAAAKTPSKPRSAFTSKKQEGSRHKTKNQQKQRHSPQNVKSNVRRPNVAIPCGKRTDFGYEKDFNDRYTIGKLLGHGQFGYTYVAVDKSNGDRVAVKRIEKNKVIIIIIVRFFFIRSLPIIENVCKFVLIKAITWAAYFFNCFVVLT